MQEIYRIGNLVLFCALPCLALGFGILYGKIPAFERLNSLISRERSEIEHSTCTKVGFFFLLLGLSGICAVVISIIEML